MNRLSLSRLARPAALVIVIASIVLIGLSGAVWATPTQSPPGHSTVPTKTPKPTKTPNPTKTPKPNKQPPQLNLSSIRCVGQNIEVHFVVVHVPDNVTSYGQVSYVVNGQNRTATFQKRTGDTAHYIDTIPPAQQPSNGVYNVTSGKVTITTTTGAFVVNLHNPGRLTVKCPT